MNHINFLFRLPEGPAIVYGDTADNKKEAVETKGIDLSKMFFYVASKGGKEVKLPETKTEKCCLESKNIEKTQPIMAQDSAHSARVSLNFVSSDFTTHIQSNSDSPESCSVKSRKMQEMCNPHVQILNESSIQATKTTCSTNCATNHLKRRCDNYDFLSPYYERTICCAAHSYRYKNSLSSKTAYLSCKRFKNKLVTLDKCLFELQNIINYLLVIFIMCQLSSLGILSCVSCLESHSSFSYHQSKYQYPPYAPPASLHIPHIPRRFLASSRADTSIREKNEHGIHPSGPNTLPLYEPKHANVSHFSEGK